MGSCTDPIGATDIVARLRDENKRLHAELHHARDGLTKGRTRMREDNERLRAALQHIILVMGPAFSPCCGGCAAEWEEALSTAREALEDKP